MQTATDKPKRTYNRRDPYAHILPFPVGPLLISQALVAADGPVYRAVILLAFIYWLTGCRDLPATDSARAGLLRMPQQHYSPIKSAIDAAMSELQPILRTEFERATQQKRARHHISQMGVQGRAKKRRVVQPSVAIPPQPTRFQPATAAPHTNARIDLAERRKVTTAPPQRHATGLLSEGGPSGRK